MFHVIAKHSVKILACTTATLATAVILKRTGSDKKIAAGVRRVGNGAVDVAAKATDALAATGELVITGAEVAVETTAFGVGVATRSVLDIGSKAGSKVSGDNPVTRGFAAGFYRPEVQALETVAAIGEPATQG